ncbi:GNAT family N-acetyltransferase [Photobacterium sp. 1_MG-2023]|uniref:GNAT family N-acetyltransferase n=1 Tax=Photobacterium sp. 1_MG-2023 TaxID=3062646 RepID=UPI0026E1C43E|nr:GNAT family N-acetyltransferase [Photobacterium sp. 1_MG-2023]MDO6707547.1 GNAT family N-acetyltransferase [Photobacterium sp. 1_MG-2023]
MKLETQQLIMAPIREQDWSLFHALHTTSLVIEKCFDAPDEDDLKDKFQGRLQPWAPESGTWLTLTITEKGSGKPVGITGFFVDHGIAEVGYLLMPEFYGKGYGTESLQAVVEWAETQGLHQMRAVVTEGNVASERVLEKCGFTLKEKIPLAYEIGGHLYADHIYQRGAF